MRQLLYVSSAKEFIGRGAMHQILTVSRTNNTRDGLSGLLWSNGTRFLQVLEGDGRTIDQTLRRIRNDLRHHAIVVLHDRQIDTPTFARWSMATLGDGDEAVTAALANADPVIRGTFQGMVQARRAA
jgi:hypothetical protein